MSQAAPLTAEHYWSADQLRVMRGLELAAWFSPVAHAVPASMPVFDAPESSATTPVSDLNGLDLAALSQAASVCQACVLGHAFKACRKPLSLNTAKHAAQWLIVLDDSRDSAELLTEAEHRLLGNMLASVGRAWDSVELTPLLKCARSASSVLDAYSDEVQACQPFLLQHIAALKPQLIVAMGVLAAQALVGVDDALASLVGETHEFEGLPLLVMPHPADLLVQTALKAQVWQTLNSLQS